MPPVRQPPKAGKYGIEHFDGYGCHDWRAVHCQFERRYIASLKDGGEVWLDGERVADVTTHAAFAGMVSELARIYDLQHSSQYQDLMTFISPETGNRCSISWQLPRSKEDLRRKRRNSEIWNRQSWGQLGRSPDILAPFIVTLYNMKNALSSIKNANCDFGENVVNYHRYCMENDLFLTHALGDPQVDRSQQPQNEARQTQEEEIALHVVEETSEGVVVHGARLFRLAHDLSVSSFGMRQEIYEYWHGGDPNRNRINLLGSYDQTEWIDQIKDLVSRPLP